MESVRGVAQGGTMGLHIILFQIAKALSWSRVFLNVDTKSGGKWSCHSQPIVWSQMLQTEVFMKSRVCVSAHSLKQRVSGDHLFITAEKFHQLTWKCTHISVSSYFYPIKWALGNVSLRINWELNKFIGKKKKLGIKICWKLFAFHRLQPHELMSQENTSQWGASVWFYFKSFLCHLLWASFTTPHSPPQKKENKTTQLIVLFCLIQFSHAHYK